MFDLQPLAQFGNGCAVARGKGFDSEEGFVLFGIEPGVFAQKILTETKEAAQQIAEFRQVAVVVGVKRHAGLTLGGLKYRTSIHWHTACSLFYIMSHPNAKSHKGFTLVEIMIVVAIIALLAAIAVPGFLRARKRSQASRILNDLRMIDSAVDQYAIETNRKTGDAVSVVDWTNYLKKGSLLYNTGNSLLGTAYGPQTVDTIPQVQAADLGVLSDVAGTGFWSPYGP